MEQLLTSGKPSRHERYLVGLNMVAPIVDDPKHHRRELERLVCNREMCQVQPFTNVTIQAIIGGRKFYAEGYAKQNPVDTWNPRVGYEIAYQRALQQLAERINEAIIIHFGELLEL